MLRAMTSELLKLRRRGMVIGGWGAIVGFSLLVVVLSLVQATEAPAIEDREGFGESIGLLSQPDGFVQALSGGATFLGVVALVIVAMGMASEYSWGTLRALLIRQPRRLVLLAGTVTALLLFIGAAVVLAVAITFPLALTLAPSQGVSTSEWLTGEGLAALTAGTGNLVLATMTWGLFGGVLGLVLRSPAPAVGVGLAYALPVELVLVGVWQDGGRWLPGQLLSTFAAGGSELISHTRSGLMLAVYVVVAGAIGAGLFLRRDVST